jgi:hypothetical protein
MGDDDADTLAAFCARRGITADTDAYERDPDDYTRTLTLGSRRDTRALTAALRRATTVR